MTTGRLKSVDCGNLSIEQQKLFDSIVGGRRAVAAGDRKLVDVEGNIVGPFNAWLVAPKLGTCWSAVGEALRFDSTLDRRLFELTVLAVAAHTKAEYEWAVHSKLALKAGVRQSVVDALGGGRRCESLESDEASCLHFVQEMLRYHGVSDATYSQALEVLGSAAVIEIVSAVGYYLALSLALNTFQVAAPEGSVMPWLLQNS